MLKRLKSVIYQVSDIEKAEKWYLKILGKGPAVSNPFKVVFDIGGVELMLVPKKPEGERGESGCTASWLVDDLDITYKDFINFGATPVTEIRSAFNTHWATFRDPFGNLFTITGEIDASRRTVEVKPSETAMGVTYLRALSAAEEREEIKGGDFLSRIFLNDDKGMNDPKIRRYILENHINYGVYEFITARTAFMDEETKRAFNENVPQMVFLGAGYDSRPYRFKDIAGRTKIFELDISPTQERKIAILKKNNIAIPDGLKYVPINFNREKIGDALMSAGYDPKLKTFFIWEGVIYYLSMDAINATFSFIKSNSAPGSSICFDYCHPHEEVRDEYGVAKMVKSWETHKNEPIIFALGRGKIEGFLGERGFKLTRHLNSEDMGKTYLTLKNGELSGRVPALYCFAKAEN
ncbi:MAG TPA: SAM-dependent methyltransferase [Candidatus Wallbacteria bacterium]|nr:SAM-dependent methyltransferase [Candidatus Wallbacteria bacterium]